MSGQVVEARWTWTGDRLESGIQVIIGPDGRISAVGRLGHEPTRCLSHHVLLPGFVNVHSHAFQRALRGRAECFPVGTGSFWSWREAMYALVDALEPGSFFGVCVQAFEEMRDAGITTVGEFHYLHHPTGAGDWAYDELVLRAAAAAGIRIVLLNAYYTAGGIGRPLEAAQRRFDSASLSAYWAQLERLDALRDPRTQTLGVAAHSIRAVRLDDIVALYEEARRRGLVLHMHVEEQTREIADCIDAYGQRPMQLLNAAIGGKNLTAVHCTHTNPDDMARFLEAGGTVCLCPLTEANLGDGIPILAPSDLFGGGLSLGTDSNARIDLIEEMRWLEYGQRLRTRARERCAIAAGRWPACCWMRRLWVAPVRLVSTPGESKSGGGRISR